jgi:hypothetical protein
MVGYLVGSSSHTPFISSGFLSFFQPRTIHDAVYASFIHPITAPSCLTHVTLQLHDSFTYIWLPWRPLQPQGTSSAMS